MKRDLVPVGRVVRKEMADLVIELKVATFREEQDTAGGELLRHRANFEHCIRLDLYREFQVCHSVARTQQYLAVTHHQHCAPWLRRGITYRGGHHRERSHPR